MTSLAVPIRATRMRTPFRTPPSSAVTQRERLQRTLAAFRHGRDGGVREHPIGGRAALAFVETQHRPPI